ncbi:hypothetical protein ACFY5C_11465 [Streptomyces sp. NPDC012935]|uniref:hypothetical protein n=1 Tax=Streptomyces sp. NPDC012935 TaxID=3364857 RepID=UPI0036C3C053
MSVLRRLMPVGLPTARQDGVRMAEYAVLFAVEPVEKPAPACPGARLGRPLR